MKIEPDHARELAEIGVKITKAANEQLGFRHPEKTGITFRFARLPSR